jgi:protein-ribulosamine 3-kinase
MRDAAALAGISESHGIALGPPEAVGGGCINTCVRCGDYFLKFNRPGFLPQFEAEAFALNALAATGTVRVPGVIGHGLAGEEAYLVLEYLPLRPLTSGAHERLGRELAQLHAHTRPAPGFPIDNAIGATPQPNPPADGWLGFWRDHRLAYMFRLAEAQGYRFKQAGRLMDRLADLLPAGVENSLLHGDLWAGNAACLPDGTPVIFDPASYHGHAETDLAMTRLFGGFSAGFYDSYHEVRPREPGLERRVALYQLYHVLNHLVLFGGGYRGQAERMIDGLV